jgi:hypothetical protein
MKWEITILLCWIACAQGADAGNPLSIQAVTDSMPDRETRILCGVAKEYALSARELKLLLTIRLIENGRAGVELGVGSNYPRHPARRFARDPDRSLRTQARWAAGTIRNHYSGDIDAFAKIYCPPKWQHWAHMARYWMRQ